MVASSSTIVRKEGKKVFHIQLIRNNMVQLTFHTILEIMYKGDPSGALSMIPPKVLMIQYVRCCYTLKVEVGDMKIRYIYQKLCDKKELKEERKKRVIQKNIL